MPQHATPITVIKYQVLGLIQEGYYDRAHDLVVDALIDYQQDKNNTRMEVCLLEDLVLLAVYHRQAKNRTIFPK